MQEVPKTRSFFGGSADSFVDVWGVIAEWFLNAGVIFRIARGERWEKEWGFWVD